ncbi:hypothetical protein OKC48_20700 [Methylorubrum extorquens]|uniref:hypothetical protein n=1 Tax=Methylorubrum extorquens TaxID=408 RepID=UPI0022370190|nr:hypothetical protein [Methylorubrum extorquens]UYW25668.1 hypothetical protein OKC48_20700 [Methylorubrum extorquens]
MRSVIALVAFRAWSTGNARGARLTLRPLRTRGASVAARPALAGRPWLALFTLRSGGADRTLRTLKAAQAVPDWSGFSGERRSKRQAEREAEKRVHQPPPMP